MNLISNTCVGACLYKCLNMNYGNPFCWNFIDFNSMYYLIENFENINFLDFTLIKDAKWNFSIIIENKIKIQYVHYKFDKNATKIKIVKADVFYNKIWEYIVEKYKERLKRMNEKPIFIIASIHKYHYYTEPEIYKICELCRKKNYKLVIANNNIDFSNIFPEFIFIKTKYTQKDFTNGPFTTKEIYPKIKEYIKAG